MYYVLAGFCLDQLIKVMRFGKSMLMKIEIIRNEEWKLDWIRRGIRNSVRYFCGRVPNFNQSEARANYFLASD